MRRLQRLLDSSTGVSVLLILGLAAGIRLLRIGDWSLWEDEETTLYFSQHTDKPFVRCFPVFFELLSKVMLVTGVSPVAGRVVATVFGVVSVWLTSVLGSRAVSPRAGQIAALLVALNLGHVFWSQSVRYYTLVLALQLLSLILFWDGLDRGRIWSILGAHAALGVAMMTHFSAVLLVPVLLTILVLVGPKPGEHTGGRLKYYLAACLPLAVTLLGPAWSYMRFRTLGLGSFAQVGPAGQNLVGIAARLAVYFGPPVVLLGAIAPLVRRPDRGRVFLSLTAFLPVLELVTISQLRMAVVAWYYIFVAMPAFAILAATALTDLWERGWRRTAAVAGGATIAYSVAMLFLYFTQMAGDRPRWKDAAEYLRDEAGVRVGGEGNPKVYASVPGVVAYYLGVPPGETMGNPLVQPWPVEPPAAEPAADQWFVIEARVIPSRYTDWLDRNCVLKARFEAKSGPFDRSVVVYQRPAATGHGR